jgi:hypothetical protein
MTDSSGPPPMPRWVKILGAAFLLLVIVVIVVHLTGRGLHGLHD